MFGISQNVLQDPKNSHAFKFFNEYAPMRDPQKATKGFAPFGFDAANISEFP